MMKLDKKKSFTLVVRCHQKENLRKVGEMKPNKYTSLIVTYNSEKDIPFLLADLFRINPAGPVVIIDNASLDQTVEIIKLQFPEALLIQNTENIGYAKAVNQGFEFCGTPYVFVLNPDIRITSSFVTRTMVEYLDSSPHVGATGPLQCITDDYEMQLNFNCSYWGWKAFSRYFYYRLFHKWFSPQPIQVPMLNAGCLMIRRAVFYQVGKLNPKYFLYGEDPDLGLKFNAIWLSKCIADKHRCGSLSRKKFTDNASRST